MVNAKTILIIEDNPMNMELASDLLQMAGYEVIECVTAEEGLKMAGSKNPDLVLMDIALPDLDGLAATKILKERENTKYIPIVAFTAHAMKGDKEKAMAARCAGYITKPINTRTFAKSISEFLSGENSQ